MKSADDQRRTNWGIKTISQSITRGFKSTAVMKAKDQNWNDDVLEKTRRG